MAKMLDEKFAVEWWFEDESPWVSCGDRLFESSCTRSAYDDEGRSFSDVVALGLFTPDNELVGYVPKELEASARGAMSSGLETVVVEEYDGKLNYAPVVRMTDSEARNAQMKRSEDAAKKGTRSAYLFAALATLAICAVIGIVLGNLISAIG